jgi:hypothetical protein
MLWINSLDLLAPSLALTIAQALRCTGSLVPFTILHAWSMADCFVARTDIRHRQTKQANERYGQSFNNWVVSVCGSEA